MGDADNGNKKDEEGQAAKKAVDTVAEGLKNASIFKDAVTTVRDTMGKVFAASDKNRKAIEQFINKWPSKQLSIVDNIFNAIKVCLEGKGASLDLIMEKMNDLDVVIKDLCSVNINNAPLNDESLNSVFAENSTILFDIDTNTNTLSTPSNKGANEKGNKVHRNAIQKLIENLNQVYKEALDSEKIELKLSPEEEKEVANLSGEALHNRLNEIRARIAEFDKIISENKKYIKVLVIENSDLDKIKSNSKDNDAFELKLFSLTSQKQNSVIKTVFDNFNQDLLAVEIKSTDSLEAKICDVNHMQNLDQIIDICFKTGKTLKTYLEDNVPKWIENDVKTTLETKMTEVNIKEIFAPLRNANVGEGIIGSCIGELETALNALAGITDVKILKETESKIDKLVQDSTSTNNDCAKIIDEIRGTLKKLHDIDPKSEARFTTLFNDILASENIDNALPANLDAFNKKADKIINGSKAEKNNDE